jgi:hypothetical protein
MDNAKSTVSQMKACSTDFEALKGRPVWELLPLLINQNPNVAEVRIQTYRPAPKLSERLRARISESDAAFLQRVDAIRNGTGVPFWDVLLGLAMVEGKLDGMMAQSALLHDPMQEAKTFTFSAGAFTHVALEKLHSRTAPEDGLVICSKVRLRDGQFRHIPMIDFRCRTGDSNARAINMLLTKTGQQTGILVESGKSYHLYGSNLLTQEEWITFMALCLLFSPVTDSRYIAHRLADGECRLKIASQDGSLPKIAGVLNAD